MNISKIENEVMQEATGFAGWTYYDLPKMRADLFNDLIDIIKEDNIHFITLAEYIENRDGKTFQLKRGQVMISPEGMDNMCNRIRGK